MPQGEPWPDYVKLPAGREEAWSKLTSYHRLKQGDPKFLVPRGNRQFGGVGDFRDGRATTLEGLRR